MDGEEPSTSSLSGTSRKSLLRSATWTARSSPSSARANPNPAKPSINRPPKPGRLNIAPVRQSYGWPRPGSDDSGDWTAFHHPSTPSPALTDDDISLVTPHVCLGSDAAARDRSALRRHGITHVLNCVGAACPEYYRGDLVYRTLWLHDSPAEDITSVLYDAFDYLEAARCEGGRVLVHCVRGASRSAAIVTAYLMWRDEIPFEDALGAVQKARPTADPNLGFAAQLLQCQRRVLDCSSSVTPSSALRAYRLAPHSAYDPLHLVPKSVDIKAAGGFGFLDSRGAFVVHHVPSAIYIWHGRTCESAMAFAATTAANQVLRYERAQCPIITVREGSEPSNFWAALAGEDNPLEAKHLRAAIGKKRVELYNLDYEIFRRALKGGVVPPVPGIDTQTRLPARETGWNRLRHRLLSGGVKELVRAVVECGRSDDDELPGTRDSIRSPGSFSTESSTTPSPTSNDYASTLSTFSSNSSSSSDWYSLSPPRSVLYKKEKGIGLLLPSSKSKTLAERRGSNAPPLILLPPVHDEKRQLSATDIVRDWCLSPPLIRDIDDDHEIHDFDWKLDPFDEDDAEEDKNIQLLYPALFLWPSMDEIKDIHPGVLNSKSVLLLLAPDSKTRMRKSNAKTIYLWVGRQSQVGMARGKEEHVQTFLSSIDANFFGRMGLQMDIRVQIIKEGQEPEEFLNHLFSFHQITESNHSPSA